MKLFIGVLLSVLVATQSAAIDDESISAHLIVPDSLFVNAWDFQGRLGELQQDINEQLTAIRTAVSTVLRSSSNVTLEQIQVNSEKLLAQDEPTRLEIFSLPSSFCVTNLKVLINAITEFTGFGSSNCVSAYDKSVQGALNTAYALLQKYEGSFADVQQLVVRSFIGVNVYIQPEVIDARFAEGYNRRVAEWAAARPEVEEFVRTLSSNVAVFNSVLGECFKSIQDKVNPSYAELRANIAVCNTFDTTPDPFAVFRP